jgi:hypothetical protein
MSTIKLVSDRRSYYRKKIPVFWGIALGYLMVATAIIAGFLAYAHNYYFALSLFFIGLAFACCLGFLIYNLMREMFCDYILEINNQDAIFSKIDNWQNKRTDQLLLLTDIKYVEYYPYQDSASIIFHTSYIDMDVPLWPMGSHAQDILDFLEGAGIKVINVQSDESIPT